MTCTDMPSLVESGKYTCVMICILTASLLPLARGSSRSGGYTGMLRSVVLTIDWFKQPYRSTSKSPFSPVATPECFIWIDWVKRSVQWAVISNQFTVLENLTDTVALWESSTGVNWWTPGGNSQFHIARYINPLDLIASQKSRCQKPRQWDT